MPWGETGQVRDFLLLFFIHTSFNIFFNILVVTKWKHLDARYSNKFLHFKISLQITSISMLEIIYSFLPRSLLHRYLKLKNKNKKSNWQEQKTTILAAA